jgi:hypothetical protein
VAQRKLPAGGKGKTYTWALDPHGMLCWINPESYQTITKLWETTEATAFHDAELAKATKAINAILGQLEKNNKDKERKVSFIRFRDQHFLVWARYGAVGQHDDEKTIIKELKLKID